MDFYKENIQSDGSLDKLNLIFLVRQYLQIKDLIGYTWSPTSPMRTLKYFLSDSVKHRSRVHQLAFIGELLQAKVKNRVFVKLDISHKDHSPDYSIYFGRALI